MFIPWEIHPMFLHLDPSNCALPISDFPIKGEDGNLDEIPLYYQIVEDGGRSMVIPLEASARIKDVVDAIQKVLYDNRYGSLFRLSSGSKRKESFISNLEDIHEEWCVNKEPPLEHAAIFICPFAVCLCFNNKMFADSRFVAGRDTLGIVPAQPHCAIASENEFMKEIQAFHNLARHTHVYFFFQPNELKKAAHEWFDRIINLLKKWCSEEQLNAMLFNSGKGLNGQTY